MDARTDMARELTADEAKELYATYWWESMEATEVARLQLHQARLCMPFRIFHSAMEKLLGRPVFTHEFANRDALIDEANGKRKPPESPIHSLAKIVGPERAAEAIAVVAPDGSGAG